jgi:hypothetical protein
MTIVNISAPTRFSPNHLYYIDDDSLFINLPATMAFCANTIASQLLIPAIVHYSRINIVWIILPIFIIYAIIILIAFLYLRRYLRIKRQKAIARLMDRAPSIVLHVTDLESIWQIEHERILIYFNEIVGKGFQGVVYRGFSSYFR